METIYISTWARWKYFETKPLYPTTFYFKMQSRPTGYFVHKRESETAIQLQREDVVRYFRSIFVTLTITSGVLYQVFKNKKINFPATKVYDKNYTENITLTEQFEH